MDYELRITDCELRITNYTTNAHLHIDSFLRSLFSSLQSVKPHRGEIFLELQFNNSNQFLAAAGASLRITNYELRIMDYELRIANYELRITNYTTNAHLHIDSFLRSLFSSLQSVKPHRGEIFLELQFNNSNQFLAAAGDSLRITNYGLRITDCELRIRA
jgi:hypothetical protein